MKGILTAWNKLAVLYRFDLILKVLVCLQEHNNFISLRFEAVVHR
jgi:hypothetical protein